MLGQAGGSTLTDVLVRRVGRMCGKQKSRDESRLAQRDWINGRTGEVRRVLVVARRNDRLIVQRD